MQLRNRQRSLKLDPLFVAGVLAILATFFAFALFTYMVIWGTDLEEKYVILIIQGILSVVLMVFGFYFGSSWGSREKDQTISKLPPVTHNHCCKGNEPEGVLPGTAPAIPEE